MSAISALPLYKIESDLMELLALAEEPDLEPEAKEAIDKQIAEYFGAEVSKTDRVAGAIRRCQSALAEVKGEIARLEGIADAWVSREKRIKDNALRAMQDHGVRVLETPTSKLLIQGNGGLHPLYVDPEREVDEFHEITVTLSLPVWCDMVKAAIEAQVITERYASELEKKHPSFPNNELIRQTLNRGLLVPGARLLPRGEHLRVK